MNIAGVNVTIKSDPIRNLRVMFDTGMAMSAQVASVLKSANYYLVNVGRARRLLMKKLQNVQRTSARLIFKKRKFYSITAELINELYWLPINQRIDYKILTKLFMDKLHLICHRYASDNYS